MGGVVVVNSIIGLGWPQVLAGIGGGIGTIRTNVAALGGLQDWVPVSWDSGEDPPVIIRLECQTIMG